MMSKQEPLLEILKKVGQTPEQYAIGSLMNLVSTDVTHFTGVSKALGSDKGLEFHKKLWRMHTSAILKSAKEAMKIGEVKDIPTLMRLVRYVFDAIPCPMKIAEDTPRKGVGIILLCPFYVFYHQQSSPLTAICWSIIMIHLNCTIIAIQSFKRSSKCS